MTRISRRLLLPVVFLLGALFCTQAKAATYTAASCNESDVSAAVSHAVNGDTVVIPTCSQTIWSSTLTIRAGITLQGAGEGQTIIEDNVPKGNAANNCTGGPAFAWSVNDTRGSTGPLPFMRMTGLTIVGIATDPDVCAKGHITVSGVTHAMRIDHITINPAQTESIYILGDVWGVIDHFTQVGGFVTGVRVEHQNWNGFSSWDDHWGDSSWAAPLSPGSNQAIYIEDSSFTNNSGSASSAATDCYSGGHIVFRYNTVNTKDMGSHGADSDQRHRACRWLEIYNNTFTYSTVNQLGFIAWIRGGSGVFYNNTVTASGYTNNMVQVDNCRDASAGCGGGPNYTPWGACNGSGTNDENATGTGSRCVDQPGSGTSCLLGPDTSGSTVTVAACSLNGNVANAWTGNILDPIYIWNNTLNGSPNNQTGGSTNVINNQSYYVGTARPGYTAYTYPHPLQGGSSPPAPPTGLQATVN